MSFPTTGGYPASALVKRARVEDEEDADADAPASKQMALTTVDGGKAKGPVHTVRRLSALQAPIVSLSGGHSAEILDCKFSPDGQWIAAAGGDNVISLWETFGENRNVGRLQGHKKAVTAICWSPTLPRSEPRLYSASADGTIIVWNGATGEKVRRLRTHKDMINCVACTRGSNPELLVSGGNDGWVFIWNPDGERWPLDRIRVGYPVTSVEFSHDGTQVFVSGLDNEVHAYDLGRRLISFNLQGHTDTILSSALSPNGSFLATYALDATVRIWDVRPFVPEPAPGHVGSPRLLRTLQGAPSGFEQLIIRTAWSADNTKVACGSADRTSTIWDVDSGKTLYKLPGHKGTCTSVAFHPSQPILLSGSTDRTMFLGELEL